MKLFLILCFFSFAAGAITLPEKIYQGDLVYGTLEEGERVFLAEKELPRKGNTFLFAVGRNAKPGLQLTLKKENLVRPFMVKVLPFAWKEEHINGVAQNTVTPSSAEQRRAGQENKKIHAARQDKTFTAFPVCFLKPLSGRYSGVFGERRVYNGTPLSPHSGLDIVAPEGTPIPVTAAGVVTLAEEDLFYTGGTVIVHHGSGIYSSYSHLSRVDVKVGQVLKQGEPIGLVGSTGRTTGPHLHLTFSWEDVRFDPARVLKDKCP